MRSSRCAVVAGDQRDAAIEAVRDAQDQRCRRRLELDRALVAEAELAGAGERHLADERQARDRGAVARVEVAQLEAIARLRSISACWRETPPARSARSHSASRPSTIFGAAHATITGLPRRFSSTLPAVSSAVSSWSSRRRYSPASSADADARARARCARRRGGRRACASRSSANASALLARAWCSARLPSRAPAPSSRRARPPSTRAPRPDDRRSLSSASPARRVIVAGDEHLGRLADLRAIALGRDALGLGRSPTARGRAPSPPASAAADPRRPSAAHRAARAISAWRVAGARGTREVHPHRALVLAGERVALRREIDVARGLGRNRGAVVGGEHPAEEAHGAQYSASRGRRRVTTPDLTRIRRQRRSELRRVVLCQFVERSLVLRAVVRLRERAPRLAEVGVDGDRLLELLDAAFVPPRSCP